MSGRTLSILTAALVLIAGCNGGGVPATPARQPIPVEVIDVAQRDLVDVYTEMATLTAARTVELAAEVAGRILPDPFDAVDEGVRVQAGDCVLALDTSVPAAQKAQAEARLRQAEAALAAARTAMRRKDILKEKKAVSDREYDEAADRLVMAEAEGAAARATLVAMDAALGKYLVRSPFVGVVSWRGAEPGEITTPGRAVLRIETTDPLRAEVHLPEAIAWRVRTDTEVSTEADGARIRGTVSRIAPTVDRITRTVKVEVDIPNGDGRLHPGAFARVAFTLERRDRVLAVPVEAVMRKAGGDVFVFVSTGTASGTVARRRDVTLGLNTAGWIQVLSGLAAGDAVVTLASPVLADGAAIDPRLLAAEVARPAAEAAPR